MAFVAEKVSAEDVIKYNLNEVNKKLHISPSGPWVIDRERDIYFRYVSVNRQDSRESRYVLFWKGYFLKIYFKTLIYNEENGIVSKTLDIVRDTPSSALFYLPPELEGKRSEIVEDLKFAIIALTECRMREYNFHYKFTFLF